MLTASQKIDFIQSVFGAGEVRRENITVRCPLCNDSRAEKKKLSIRLTDDLNHCWVCGWKARSLVPLLRKFAPDKLQEYKVFNPFIGDNVHINLEDIPLVLPSDFKLLAAVRGDPYADRLIEYLSRRGIGIREMWRWKIGYSRTEKWIDRVIVPSFDRNGDLNYFTGRIVTDQQYRKYENCDVKRTEIVFDEMNIDWKKELVLVEGPFDLVKCRMNATCILGSSISEEALLHDKILFNGTPVVLMLDNDMQDKMLYLAKRFMSYGLSVKCVFLGEKDPGQMSPAAVEEAVKNAKFLTEYDLMKLKLHRTIENSSGSIWKNETVTF
jgi:hypothetical protein